ncbi:MAG: toll/interleukin-1 receptor domain-containing protein [Candidatus Poribacteria bacterium]|nr:toll/interleukin-1 receptor domain-containing protein [Candidatus Poribacteria bacterium]
MANEEHVKRLLAGVKEWNKWREENHLVRPDLVEAKLRRADLREADLFRADLSGANLIEADLIEANLVEANLSVADLSVADLSVADLRGANLRGANLRGAWLDFTVMDDTDLTDTDFTDAVFAFTKLADLDLRRAVGLETVRHRAPSTLGIDTLVKSEGQIPDVFMRGCGVPETIITFAKSLVANPIQYYTCFISYADTDKLFVTRLHNDLQAAGVRCWYAPHDLTIGAKMAETFDREIRWRDRLIVVLSADSLERDWVEFEVGKAMNEESTRGKTVLFPIRLDDAVFRSPKPWAKALREDRFIGDFRFRADDAEYQKAFDRVLRDLQAPADTPPAPPE